METNNYERFGRALDNFEKAKAKRDFKSACENLLEAIDCNPYPSLYEHLAASLRLSSEAYAYEMEATRPKSLAEKLQRALFAPLGKEQKAPEGFGYMA